MISFSTSHNVFCWFECHGQHNARGSDKSFLPSLEGSCFETSFGLAGFTETPEVYFVEQEVHLAGSVIVAARQKGVILQCRMTRAIHCFVQQVTGLKYRCSQPSS